MEIEPFGEERGDLRSGIIASTIANVNRDPKKSRPFRPKDFMPRFTDDDKQTSAAKVTNERKPIATSEEWNKTVSMMRLFSSGLNEKKQVN